ncbi:MAG TPA: aromatic ring-opening dioxygenase subunit LigB [Thermomicrobiales bacterium]|nr:aromatic ring-opening dioxygenase subunit LigB [Thermomicrobiales bacterium]
MPIVFAAVVPHGWTLIPELEPDPGTTPNVRRALTVLRERCAAAHPDVIVIAGPHNVRIDGYVAVAGSGRAAGTLHYRDRQIEMNVPIDTVLSDAIAATAKAQQIPVATWGYAGNQRSESAAPLDWGIMVPLWYLGHGTNMVGHGDVLASKPKSDVGPPIVLLNPSRALPLTDLVRFGEAVSDAVVADGRRVAFIASCDWAHAHAGSRYGAHPDAEVVDGLVLDALRAADPGRLIDLDPQQIKNAAIDGLWQALILAGVMNRVPMAGELLAYEVESGSSCGMAVATYLPTT